MAASTQAETPGWAVKSDWQQGPGQYDMHQRYCIVGPLPFGGLICEDEEQAQEVADALNKLTGRAPPKAATPTPKPDPTAVELADALTGELSGSGVRVAVNGTAVTITWPKE